MILTIYMRDNILKWLKSDSEVTNLGLSPGHAVQYQHTIRFAVVEKKLGGGGGGGGDDDDDDDDDNDDSGNDNDSSSIHLLTALLACSMY